MRTTKSIEYIFYSFVLNKKAIIVNTINRAAKGHGVAAPVCFEIRTPIMNIGVNQQLFTTSKKYLDHLCLLAKKMTNRHAILTDKNPAADVFILSVNNNLRLPPKLSYSSPNAFLWYGIIFGIVAYTTLVIRSHTDTIVLRIRLILRFMLKTVFLCYYCLKF